MVYKVVLSERAIKDIDTTVDYLLKKWTVKEADSFLNKLGEFKKTVSRNPLLFGYYHKIKGIHKVVLTKHNLIFYKIDYDDKIIQIITVFNAFQDPDKLKI